MTNLYPLDIWRRAMVDNVSRDAPDLSARQMAVLLTVYMTPPPHTVRGLAEILNVSKPAITRALDRLGEYHLARRKSDAHDRRSVLVQRTVNGSVYLSEFAEIIGRASEASTEELAGKAARAAARKAKKAPAKPAVKPQPVATETGTVTSRPATAATSTLRKQPATG